MKLQQVLNDYAFPPEYIKAIMSSGILDLYEPQADAINKGVLDGENLLMSVPTAAGKTLIAELSILKSLMNKPGLCLYMAPLKALASEKYKDFKKKYEPLGYKVVLAVGDQNASYQTLQDVDILVATAEKVDSLLRFKAQWLLDSLRVVIIDEIHFINDGSRGPTLEILAARMMQLCSDVQIIALSATVQNAQDMAKWLNARCVLSTWRPIPLKEGVYFHGKIKFNGHGTRLIDKTVRDEISNITLDTLRDNGQVLIFVNSRRSAQAVSRQVSAAVAKVLTDEEKEKLALLAKKIAGNQLDLTTRPFDMARPFITRD
ncbi:MAG: DEAD/DEAH box helicase [Candidatus Omnitrophica bacterium]|nr:DEAD/DEAH box helicase [Candidatus Omnitrophota bacterium]